MPDSEVREAGEASEGVWEQICILERAAQAAEVELG